MKKILLCILSILVFFNFSFCQSNNQTLEDKLLKTSIDSVKLDFLISLLEENKSNDADRAIKYGKQGIILALKLKHNKKLSDIYNGLGVSYANKGDYKLALESFFKCLKIKENILETTPSNANKNKVAAVLNNIGNLFKLQQKYDVALQYLYKSLSQKKELGDKKGMAKSYINIGGVYQKLHNSKIDSAYLSYIEAEKILTELNDEKGLALVYNNLGIFFDYKKNYAKALQYYLKSSTIKEKNKEIAELSLSYNNIASIYLIENKHDKALLYAKKALEYSAITKSRNNLKNSYDILSQIYYNKGQFKEAYNATRNWSFYKDSLYVDELAKSNAELATKYETDKKQKEIALLNKDKELDKLELKKQKQVILFSIIGLVLFLSFGLFSYSRYKLTQRQKQIIDNQKNIVEQQKHLVEEKQKEIVDSITYAKRLQQAILPPNNLIQKYLPNSFILYKPKDIVAGDFYWLEHKNDLVMIAAADCTGHGVPGAMVSVVCSNALNRTVKEFGLTEPGKILDKVRELVIETFEKSESEVKDGMDISLCVIDFKTKKLLWSGANNPLWIIRREIGDNRYETEKLGSQISNLNSHILLEYKADKQPIGKYADLKPFTTNEIELQKDDSLYIFTDGYADQFGGEKGKKYKGSKMKELLLSIQNEEMETQQKLIDESFELWRGNLEQIDDVCLIGINI
ncbi:MAG: SpoIIE family protein phosphatase [Bacteroidota bacterium]